MLLEVEKPKKRRTMLLLMAEKDKQENDSTGAVREQSLGAGGV